MATGKELRDRIFAMSGAILFFVTASALTIAVIVTNVQESNQKKADAKAASSGQQTKVNGKLQGAKLAGFTPISAVTAIKTTDLKVGTGKEVSSVNDTVTADYTGAVAATGVIFQSSLDSGQPFTTQLSGVIQGWQTGMIGMKEGGKRRLLIPADQAYAASPPQGSGIPANAPLVFDITLKTVK